jgi:hypothetical protein
VEALTNLEKELIVRTESLMRLCGEQDEKLRQYRDRMRELQGAEGMLEDQAADWLRAKGWTCQKT